MEILIELKVEKIKNYGDDSSFILLKDVNNKIQNFKPGQFLTFLINLNEKEVKRAYSICTSPFELPFLGIAVKRTKDGFSSDYFVNDIKEGDILKSLLPLGNFTISPDKNLERNIFLFAGGSGITPLMSMLKSVLQEESKSKVTLFYGNRYEDSIILKDELNKLVERYSGRLKIFYSVSKPTLGFNGIKGRLTRDVLINKISENNLTFDEKSEFYMCGPSGMMEEVVKALKTFGINESEIKKESYTPTVKQTEVEDKIIDRYVTINFLGQEHKILVPSGKSILETALENGIDLPHSCKSGYCSTCRAALLSGNISLVNQLALTEEDIADGFCLTCVGFPLTDNVIIDYD